MAEGLSHVFPVDTVDGRVHSTAFKSEFFCDSARLGPFARSLPHGADNVFGKNRVRRFFSFVGRAVMAFVSQNMERVCRVFGEGAPFKIFRSIVSFDAVKMIDDVFPINRGQEGKSNHAMKGDTLLMLGCYRDKTIKITSAVSGATHNAARPAHPAEAACLVLREVRHWFPKLTHAAINNGSGAFVKEIVL